MDRKGRIMAAKKKVDKTLYDETSIESLSPLVKKF